MVFIVSDQRIATENFEKGKIYKVVFLDESIFYGVCIGIGSNFVMLSGNISGYLFPLTMETASQVESIDLYTPVEPEPPVPPLTNLLQYQTGLPPFTFNTIAADLFSWYIKGNMQQSGTPTPSAPIYPTECGTLVTEGTYSGQYEIPVQCNDIISSIYTDEPIRKIGEYTDYKSESVEYRVVKKLVMTGAEDIIFASVTQGNLLRYQTSEKLGIEGNIVGICSHYPVVARTNRANKTLSGNSGLTLMQFDFIDNDYNDSTAFKTFLQEQYVGGTPVTILYVLATPKTTAISAASIITDIGDNTLSVLTEAQPSEMQIVYKIADR